MFSTVSAVNCYECNVWKSGYGYTCDEPRIKYNCITCMKIDTTIFMGFYKNTPRSKLCSFFILYSNNINAIGSLGMTVHLASYLHCPLTTN